MIGKFPKTEQTMSEAALHEKPAVDAAAALAGFFRIMDLWQVDNEQARVLLGTPSPSTFYVWRKGGPVRPSPDTLRRIGYIAGIYKALQILYSEPALADGWLHRPNRAFGEQTPLQRMAAGDVVDLAAVRAYLDGARSPWS
jgi:hypothetical protein